MKDFLREVSDRFLTAALRADLPTEAMERLEREVRREEHSMRQEVGGDRVYSRKLEAATDQKKARIVADYLNSNAPVVEVARRNGISRATLYNLIKR